MHNKVRKLVKNILMVSIVCAFLVGCGASEIESNTEGQSTLNNVSENLSENIETENKTTSKQMPTMLRLSHSRLTQTLQVISLLQLTMTRLFLVRTVMFV